MTTVDPQEVIDRGLRLDPDRAAVLAQRVLAAEQQVANVQALAAAWRARGEHDQQYATTLPDDMADALMESGADWIDMAGKVEHALAARRAAPTPGPTIADHDGFGAPIMDHAKEPQPTDIRKFYGTGSACKAHRDGDCDWVLCPQLRDKEPATSGRHCPRDARQQEPVERITDDRGDETEHGTEPHTFGALGAAIARARANQPQDGGA